MHFLKMGILIRSKECMECFFERGCIVVNLSKRVKIHFFSQVLWQKGTCVCVRRESALCEESCVSMSML